MRIFRRRRFTFTRPSIQEWAFGVRWIDGGDDGEICHREHRGHGGELDAALSGQGALIFNSLGGLRLATLGFWIFSLSGHVRHVRRRENEGGDNGDVGAPFWTVGFFGTEGADDKKVARCDD